MENAISVRKLDQLGRIVIPMEMRKDLGIGIRDNIVIKQEGNTIHLQKYTNTCCICGSKENVKEHSGMKICEKCLKSFK